MIKKENQEFRTKLNLIAATKNDSTNVYINSDVGRAIAFL